MKSSVISTIFRLAELLTTIVCLILHFKTPEETDPLTIIMSSGTFFGYTLILVGRFAMKNDGNPISKKTDVGISLLGCILFIATGALIFVEWDRNDVERVKRCLPAIDNHSRNNGIVQKIITFMTHAAADSVASRLDKFGIQYFLYSSETYTMAVVKASLSISIGILFIFDIVVTHQLRDIFKELKTPETQTQKA